MQYATDVTFANGVRLLGYSVQPDTLQNPGESEALRLTLFWEARRRTARSQTMHKAILMRLST